jgi:hypothetical protein
MGHKTSLPAVYNTAPKFYILDDYLIAVDYLTINRDQKIASQLQKQFVEVTAKYAEVTARSEQ